VGAGEFGITYSHKNGYINIIQEVIFDFFWLFTAKKYLITLEKYMEHIKGSFWIVRLSTLICYPQMSPSLHSPSLEIRFLGKKFRGCRNEGLLR